ncbi:MAG: hypothetical protein R3292_06035 [Alcanivorax sp.]|nr:hypothetical protein [Alcanivorax sp.]
MLTRISRSSSLVFPGFALGLLIFCSPALGQIRINPTSFTGTATWSGGDISQTVDTCVSSTQEPNPSGITLINYRVEAAAPLTLDSGADTLPVELVWKDLTTGISQNLQANTPSNSLFTGALQGCPTGNNGQLQILVREQDISAVPPGVYSQQFSLTLTNAGRGRPQATFTATLTLTIPDSIRVSDVNDIALGTFDGINNLTGSDQLCIYRASGGLYGVTLTGSGSNGAFTLSAGSSTVPYTVSWNDGSGAQNASAGTLISGLGNTYSNDMSCAGGAADNATVSVTANASDIAGNATSAGTHSGVLYIMIEMQ